MDTIVSAAGMYDEPDMGIGLAFGLDDEPCYVCRYGRHADSTEHGGHRYWPESEAAAEFTAEPATTYSPEAAFVATYRPY
jgi:hypothetical protein